MKTEFILRTAPEYDSAELRRIWQTAFKDSNGEIAAFYKCWQGHAQTIVADCAGTPASAGYLLPVGVFMGKPCAMIYAVATLPQYRGHGLAAEVTRGLIAAAHKSGYHAVIVCPADDGLFGYYSRVTDFRDGFYVRQLHVPHSEIPRSEGSITELAAGDYMRLREDFLRDTVHVEQDLRVWEYQSVLCGVSGGGLYKINLPDTSGCAVIERTDDDTVTVKELLIPRKKDERAALSAIAVSFNANMYIVRTQTAGAQDSTYLRRFGMLALSPEMANFPGSAYFGMAFD